MMRLNLSPYRKAAAALVVSFAGLIGTAALDGAVTSSELVASLGGALVTTAAVYGFRNKPV